MSKTILDIRFESAKANAFMNEGDDQVYLAIDGVHDRVWIIEDTPDGFLEGMSQEDKQLCWDTFKIDCWGVGDDQIDATAQTSHTQVPPTEMEKAIGDLRGLLFANAPQLKNDRFMMAKDADEPAVHIMDTETGKTVRISLCDLHGAINVLNAFFPK